MHSRMELPQLFIHIACQRRVADIGINLAQRLHPNRHRLQLRMVDIRRDDHRPLSNLAPHQFCGNLLFLGHIGHLFRNQSLTRKVHLRHILVARSCRLGLALYDPFGPARWYFVAIFILIQAHRSPLRQNRHPSRITGFSHEYTSAPNPTPSTHPRHPCSHKHIGSTFHLSTRRYPRLP